MPAPANGPLGNPSQAGARFTIIGESLVDIILDTRRGNAVPETHPGGSPLNVAVGCSRLGLRTRLVTHFADDSHGRIIAEHLAANAVETIVGGTLPTSTASASLDATGAAQYAFSISWDMDGARIPALAAVESSLHVHTGSIATVLPPGNRSVRGLLETARHRATISFDPNCRPAISQDVALARDEAEDFVAVSDIVRASDEDLQWLYPDRTLDESMAAWLDLGPAMVAVTRGPLGPVILTGRGRVEPPGKTIPVTDTVGAGDAFMAALISGLAQMDVLGAASRSSLHGLGLDELHSLATYANNAASITCSRQGANPPTLAELGPLPRTATPAAGDPRG
jgi:fructokinase